MYMFHTVHEILCTCMKLYMYETEQHDTYRPQLSVVAYSYQGYPRHHTVHVVHSIQVLHHPLLFYTVQYTCLSMY